MLKLKMGKKDYGIVGEQTGFKTKDGKSLNVGDVAKVISTSSNYSFESIVVKDNQNGAFLMGILSACKHGKISDWEVTDIIKKYHSIKAGEKYHDITVYEYNEQINNNGENKIMINKLRVGDKVKLPKTKSTGSGIEFSNIVKRAINQNQDYLYITEIEGGIHILDLRKDSKTGDYFLIQDLEKYEDNKNQLEIITSGKTTIVKFSDGREGKAKPYYKDTFNPYFGIVVALGKALGVDLVEEVKKVIAGYEAEGKQEIIPIPIIKEELKIGDYVTSSKGVNGSWVGKIIEIENNHQVWSYWSENRILDSDLPKTIKEFENIEKDARKSWSGIEIVERLILEDDSKTEEKLKVNEYIWEKFLNHKIAVWFKTKEESDKFLRYCEDLNIKWASGRKATDRDYFTTNNRVAYLCDKDRLTKLEFPFMSSYKTVTFEKLFTPVRKNIGYKIGQEVSKQEAIDIIETGGSIVNDWDYVYFKENGILKYRTKFGRVLTSSGYNGNLNGINTIETLGKN